MKIGGFIPTSFIDFPQKLSCTIFLQGCNLRCSYCYNPSLIPKKISKDPFHQTIGEAGFFRFLVKRRYLLEGVTITGGEPTIQKGLPEFILKIKDMGYKVKLDSNGTNPSMLRHLLKKSMLDYIAMDIKAPLKGYTSVTNSVVDVDVIKESVNLIRSSNIPYEFRTVAIPTLTYSDLIRTAKMVQGSSLYVLQTFKKDAAIVDETLKNVTHLEVDLEKTRNTILSQQIVRRCIIR